VLAGAGLAALVEAVMRRGQTQMVAESFSKNQRSSAAIRPPSLVAAGLVALVLLDFAAIPYPVSPPDTPDFYHTLAADERDGGVMNLPMGWDRPGYLLYQTVHGKPLIAGYISRTDPRTLPGRVPVINRFRLLAEDINHVDDPALLAPTIFEFVDIRWVILDRYKMPPGFERDFDEKLIQDIFGAKQPVYKDERLTVYETSQPTEHYPFVEIGWDFGPLQEGPARQVEDNAFIIVHAPQPGNYILTITPGTDNVAWSLLDDEGKELVVGTGKAHSIPVFLPATSNKFVIQALQPGLKIHRIEIKPYP